MNAMYDLAILKLLRRLFEFAQIYDDTSKKEAPRSNTYEGGNGKNNSQKRKAFFSWNKQSKQNKKPKAKFTPARGGQGQGQGSGSYKTLSKEQLSKAKAEGLCFHCMSPDHPKKDCPKLNEDKRGSDKGKEKVVHTVQVLPLDSDKIKEVTVSHYDATHSCCVTKSMFVPPFGPHDLVCMHGTINGHKVNVMIDDSATHNFLNYSLVKRLKLTQTASEHKYVVSLANGYDQSVWDTVVLGVPLSLQGYEATLDFQVMHLARADVILGREWLFHLGATLKRSYLDNSFEFEHNGKTIRLQGEHDVPTAPLICSLELQKAFYNDEVDKVFCCSLYLEDLFVSHAVCDAFKSQESLESSLFESICFQPC